MGILLLEQDDVTRLTNISGNVDVDKIVPFINMAQRNKMRRILGNDLYYKILEDYGSDSLEGEYKNIYDLFVVDILVYYTASYYWSIGQYEIDNSGAHLKNGDNYEPMEEDTILRISKTYEQQASALELEFFEYMKTVNIPEYKADCTSSKVVNLNWYFGK